MAAGSKKLARNVAVGGVMYPAGSTPDKEIADQITNPKAWVDGDDATPAQKLLAERAKRPATTKK